MLVIEVAFVSGRLYGRVGAILTLVPAVLAVLHLMSSEGIVIRSPVVTNIATKRFFS